MADNDDKPAISLEQFVQEGRKKKAAENLAQKLLGSGRRSSAPPTGPKGLTGSLASRVGVNKPRNSSIPRNNPPRNSRAAPPLNRLRSDISDVPTRPSSTRPEVGSRSNSSIVNGSAGLSIRGAASAPVVIVAQNFAPGTTAADIESVMYKVGGDLTSCRLVSSTPTVIAEMVFVDPAGADNVIEQFNGKKADGRTLYVYRRDDGGARRPTAPVALAPPTSKPIPISSEDDAMMVDEATEAREANNRMREERRGREDRERERDRERDVFPSGPGGYRDDYYDRGAPRRSEGGYSDGRYWYGGPRDGYGPRGGGGYGGRDRGYGGGRGWR